MFKNVKRTLFEGVDYSKNLSTSENDTYYYFWIGLRSM
jgi:hypothetical protein